MSPSSQKPAHTPVDLCKKRILPDMHITSTASSETNTKPKLHILHAPTAYATKTYHTQLPKHPQATCKILNMSPKTKRAPTANLANWCRVRCSVSRTMSWSSLSTSLKTPPTSARLWQWRHLQGMREHHIFHSPNAHEQKTYIMHIFPNMSFFHNYLHLQQLQMKHKQ